MKRIKSILFLFVAVFVLLFTGCSKQVAEAENNASIQDKATKESEYSEVGKTSADISTLIVYYSYSGTTKRVAEHLQTLTGGELYELKLETPYTGSSNNVSDRVFDERAREEMPKLLGELPDLSKYDRILIGTPVWNDSMSNPIIGYLKQTDFGGKTVSLFWTYITNEGTTEQDFIAYVQNAKVAEGLPLRSANSISDSELDRELQTWIRGIEVK